MSQISIRRFYGTRPKKPPQPFYGAPDRPMALRLSGVVDSWLDWCRGGSPQSRLLFLNACLAVCRSGLNAFDEDALPVAYKDLTRSDLEVAEDRVLAAIRITPSASEAV